MPGEKREEKPGRRMQRRRKRRRGEGSGVGAWLLLVVVVADGGQPLAYCHSPLTGQITSEHCLAGQVQNPATPPTLHHLLMPVYMYAHRTGRDTHEVEMCVCVCVFG